MNNDPIVYTSEEAGTIPARTQTPSRGLAGFLVAKGVVGSTSQANAVLVIVSIVLIIIAIIIPFVW